MTKKSLFLSFITISFIVSGCATRKCVGKDAYNGLYNALTCDYQKNIDDLTLILDQKTLERNKHFYQFQRLIAQVTNKKSILYQLEQEIATIDNDLKHINSLIKKLNTDKSSTITILKLKQKLRQLSMDILNKSTVFDFEDAVFTKNKLLNKEDISKEHYAKAYIENSTKEHYAKAYIEDTTKEKFAKAYHENEDISKEHYAKAYMENSTKKHYAKAYIKYTTKEKFAKAYYEDVKYSKQIKIAIAKKIQNASDALNSNTVEETKKVLLSTVKEVQAYKDSLKS